jgi:serine/threonine protein kinase
LRVLHEKGIVHRDIKPENVVYNPKKRSIKLIDFGFAACLSSKSVVYSNCGTPGYAAPESFTKNYTPSP